MEWIKHPKNNPPPEGVLVEVLGTDYIGDWIMVAKRIDYRPGSSKRQMKRKWRWCDADGYAIGDQAVEAWRHINYSERR